MKKSTLNKIIAGVMMSTTLATVACGKKDNKPVTVESYEISTGNHQYNVYDTFSFQDLKLKLRMSDGKIKEIDITRNMIVDSTMPDMTTTGTKTIKVVYDGKEYEFSINVKGYSKEDMLARLNEFKANYDAMTDAGSTTVNMSVSASGEFLGKSGEMASDIPELTITQDQVNSVGDELVSSLYSSIIGGITKSGLETSLENIINSNQLKARLDWLKTGKNLLGELKNFNYVDYFLSQMISSEEDSYQEVITGGLADLFQISDKDGKDALYNWVDVNLTKIGQFESIDMAAVIEELKDIIEEYNPTLYENISSAVESVENPTGHELSAFFEALSQSEEEIFIAYNLQGTSLPKSEEIVEFQQAYLSEIASLIKLYEDTVISSINEEEVDLEAVFESASEICANIFALRSYCETNNWDDTRYGFNYFEEASNILNKYHEDCLKYIANILEEYDIIDELLEMISENSLSEEFKATIKGIIVDALRCNEEYDYETYIKAICNECDITDEEVVNGFIEEFEASKTFSLASYALEQLREYYLEKNNTYSVEVLTDAIALVKYIEQLPVSLTTEVEEDKYSTETLFGLIKALADETITQIELKMEQESNDDEPSSGGGAYVEDIVNVEGVRNSNGYMSLKLISHMFDTTKTPYANVQGFIDDYSDRFTEELTIVLCGVMGLFENEDAVTAVYDLVATAMEDYLNDELDMSTIILGLLDTVNTYGTEAQKGVINSLVVCTTIIATKDMGIDYNELFEGMVTLPEGAEPIDYNLMVERIFESDTYKDLIKINDIEVQYITNEQKQIVKQVLTLSVETSLDVVVASFDGSFRINIEVEF